MAQWVHIKDIAAYEGQQITIKGWLYNRRDKGKLQFLLVRDGSGIVQCVASQRDIPAQAFDNAQRVTQESSIIVTGKVRADKRAPGGYELQLDDVQIVQLPHHAQGAWRRFLDVSSPSLDPLCTATCDPAYSRRSGQSHSGLAG
jgi:aspartyl/asparaginyl-tRNA synthetase